MPLSVLILGSGSALPTISANQTSQIVYCNNQTFLVDCGEGTQIELRRNRVRIQAIDNIFISHLHGDHFFGLVGLLSTMHLLGRKNELSIFGPEGLEEIVRLQFQNAGNYLSFKMNFTVVNKGGQIVLDNSKITVTSIPLKHRIPCYGYKFQEKVGLRKLNVKAIEQYRIPTHARKGITEGADFVTESGEQIQNKLLTSDPPSAQSYAFCSDTAYYEKIIPLIKDVDMLYHESTFLEKDAERAKKTYHSTAKQAALIAKMAGVNKLLLGHFSNRYSQKESFLEEARETFNETYIAEEGKVFLAK